MKYNIEKLKSAIAGSITQQECKYLAKEFSKICKELLPPEEMEELIVKHIHPISKKNYEGESCAKWLNHWSDMNNIGVGFKWSYSGGMYSNPRIRGWKAGASGNDLTGIFHEYNLGNAWVGSSENAVIVVELKD